MRPVSSALIPRPLCRAFLILAGLNASQPGLPAPAPTNMTPVAVTGWNRDFIVESTATGPPFTNYASEMNAGEGMAFYQNGLAGTSNGLPRSGAFAGAVDGTLYQFQPFAGNNALVMSTDTWISAGALTLATPVTYNSLAISHRRQY